MYVNYCIQFLLHNKSSSLIQKKILLVFHQRYGQFHRCVVEDFYLGNIKLIAKLQLSHIVNEWIFTIREENI